MKQIPWNKGLRGKQSHSAETRAKISKALSERIISDETRRKLSVSQTGKHHSIETREKIGAIHRGVKHPIERNIKYSETRIKYMAEHPGPYKDTLPERLIENELILRGIIYSKQYYIKEIRHCADFFIEPNILIECDGNYWHNRPEAKERDREQTRLLINRGFDVYRFWESEIYDSAKDCVEIVLVCR